MQEHDEQARCVEYQGAGRVRFSIVYAGGVSGDWVALSESVENLHNLSAIDETDPKKPTVVIPNYRPVTQVV